MPDLGAMAREMLSVMDQGDMGVSTYDAAWVARVREPGTHRFAFPEVRQWLRRAQRPDGSWGCDIEFFPARVVATLAATIALADEDPERRDLEQLQRGEAYLRRVWPQLNDTPYQTIGFEMILPTLMEEARRFHVKVPESAGDVGEMRRQKLQRIPPDLIYSPELPMGYSLEFLGDHLDRARAERLVLGDGSIANSVSATAYYAHLTGDERAVAFLRRVVQKCGPERVTYAYPLDLFEKMWVLYNLHLAGMLTELREQARPMLDYIQHCWTPTGVGWSSLCPMTDSDDSAVALFLLQEHGYDVDQAVFEPDEREDHFQCYRYERDPSISANTHILHAMQNAGYKNRSAAIAKLLRFLKTKRVRETYWDDKWHISPYYATSHVVIAAAHHDLGLVEDAVRWIERAQNPADGSWGRWGRPTAEESAYCLQALASFARSGGRVDRGVIERGAAFLEPHASASADTFPAMWVAKDLYCPTHVVRSAIIGALAMCRALLS